MTALRKFHWFWPWQDDREEAWLASMARQGLHLARVNAFGRYDFESGEPREMVYRLDYRGPARKDRDDYLRLFSDAGWEHLGEMSSWQYFRKPAGDGEPEEIYTDTASKIEKYRRISTAMLPLLVMWMFLLNTSRWQSSVLSGVLQAVVFFIFVLYLYILTNLLRRISQLRKQKPAEKM